ncbi:MAG: chalcone isomerase family protein [Myxococcota bacterium]|nr:chalcone isomerase family protein [Myxococcota bacterium]
MFLLFGLLQGWAASLAGVSLPDTVNVADQTLILNGIGLREKFWVDVYVAGLYLPEKNKNGLDIIRAEVPKRISIEFIYHSVSKEKMKNTLEDNLRQNPELEKSVRPKMKRAYAWFEDFRAKDTLIFEYIPNKGTTIFINQQKKGVIEGSDFMTAIFTIYLGPNPASEPLKKKLLGL